MLRFLFACFVLTVLFVMGILYIPFSPVVVAYDCFMNRHPKYIS
jgi:hypothetical protein